MTNETQHYRGFTITTKPFGIGRDGRPRYTWEYVGNGLSLPINGTSGYRSEKLAMGFAKDYINERTAAIDEVDNHAQPDVPQPIVVCDGCRTIAPQPNWDEAPSWANWWAVDPDGYYHWFDNEPILTQVTGYRELIGPHWSHFGSKQHLYDAINIPIGIDWRTLKQQRSPAEAQP